MNKGYVVRSKLTEMIQTLIMSGVLFTLLGIAYMIGQTMKSIEMKLDDHERRITRLEM